MNAGSWSQGIGSNGGTNSLGQGIIEGFPETLDIGWEIEKKQNYGFDLGLFNNKIDIVFDYFRTERSNILMQKKNYTNIKWLSCKTNMPIMESYPTMV